MKADKGHEGKVEDVTSLRSSQGNHTPGPWRIWKGDAGEMKYLVGADDQGFAHTVGLGEPRDTANARLIAAAPELLKLVSDHIQIFALQALRDSADPKTLEGWRVLQAAAAAVLAKAKP